MESAGALQETIIMAAQDTEKMEMNKAAYGLLIIVFG